MKRILLILLIIFLLANCVNASEKIEINDVKFEIPSKCSGGEISDKEYELDNEFSIRCVDDDIIQAMGLWASECESSKDINIDKHPVRHFCQYNRYVGGDHSHAYFASGQSVYEISWVGDKINSDITKLIKNTPQSEIDDDAFYTALDKSVDLYKQQRKDKLNQEAEYNYLESKYSSSNPKTHDDTRFRQILYTYYLNRR